MPKRVEPDEPGRKADHKQRTMDGNAFDASSTPTSSMKARVALSACIMVVGATVPLLVHASPFFYCRGRLLTHARHPLRNPGHRSGIANRKFPGFFISDGGRATWAADPSST
jgi:hypothetical protein